MISKNREGLAGWIDGFLFGVCALNGSIREYEGSAYWIELDDESSDVGSKINEYFRGRHEFSFTSTEVLAGDLGELEARVVRYLLPDFSRVTDEYASELGQYLAFRLLDMITFAFDVIPFEAEVTQLSDSSTADEHTFFAITSGKLLLVLQFKKHGN